MSNPKSSVKKKNFLKNLEDDNFKLHNILENFNYDLLECVQDKYFDNEINDLS